MDTDPLTPAGRGAVTAAVAAVVVAVVLVVVVHPALRAPAAPALAGAAAAAAVDDAEPTDAGATLPPVSAPESQRFTLTSRTATIPLALVNGSDQPVDVLVRLFSDKLTFPGGAQLALTLQPGRNSFDVDVSARTTGDSLLVIRVLTSDGLTEIDRARITVRSTALSGVGIAIAVVALAVLLVWWVRNRRDLRRDRRLVSDDASPASASNPLTEGPGR